MSVWDNLHKLKDALGGDDARPPAGGSNGQPEVRSETHKRVEEGREKEGWSERIKDVLDGDDEKRRQEEEELKLKTERQKAEAKEKIERERSGLGEKMHDLLDHGEEKRRLEEVEFARIDAQAAEESAKILGVRGKLLDVIDGKPNPQTPQEQKESGLKDKIKELWGQQDEKEVVKEEGLMGKVRDVLQSDEAKDKKKKENQRGWFSEKMNEMAGGGKKAELDEDGLDKAIDFFQHHMLKKGDQDDESAIEQLKDEQIATGIKLAYKNATGHDFPSRDK
jgi:hypothetical protein